MNCSIWDGPLSFPFLLSTDGRTAGGASLTGKPSIVSPSTSAPSSSSPPNALFEAAAGAREDAACPRRGGAEMRGPADGRGGGRSLLSPPVSPARTNLFGLSGPPSNSSMKRACSAASASSCSLRFAASSSLRFWKAVFFVPPRLNDASLSVVIDLMAPGLMEPGSNPNGS